MYFLPALLFFGLFLFFLTKHNDTVKGAIAGTRYVRDYYDTDNAVVIAGSILGALVYGLVWPISVSITALGLIGYAIMRKAIK